MSKRSRNPFCKLIERGGMILMPLSAEDAKLPSRNPYYKRIAKEGIRIGRPSKDEGPRPPTHVRSVRLPEALWAKVEAQAEREGIPVNAALRQAALMWIRV